MVETSVNGSSIKRSLATARLLNIRVMELTDNLIAFVERKPSSPEHTSCVGNRVILGNTGRSSDHSMTRFSTRQMRAVVKGAMEAGGAVLIKRYGVDADKHAAYIQRILVCFEEPHLKDGGERVVCQPLRKPRTGDRLIKPPVRYAGIWSATHKTGLKLWLLQCTSAVKMIR